MRPPVNYVLECGSGMSAQLAKIENRIFGTLSNYPYSMKGWNTLNFTYMAYPVGEFCNIASVVDQPLKEVYIGKDDKVRSIKTYSYYTGDNYIHKRYGYKMVSQNSNYPSTPTESLSSDYTIYYISRSEYITRNVRLSGTNTVTYYYDGEKCDSVCEEFRTTYNNGRTSSTSYARGEENTIETKYSQYYYPSDIKNIADNNIAGNNSQSLLAAAKKLVEKNMIADPIKTVVERNGKIVGGECKDYQLVTDTIPLLKTLYKFKNTDNNSFVVPTIGDNTINYHADLYKEGEILKYDVFMNPVYVRLKNTQDRIYVWGYDGRYPIAVIDNMSFDKFEAITNLKTEILKLQNLKKIETAKEYADLKSKNLAIRNLLPKDAHITTYTYDPYFGMTSETDDSNLGIIYTYDTFGRLTSKYDTDFNKTEEYNYHYKLQ